MTWYFLDVAAVKVLQADLINSYGGSHGLRDAGVLESAVARAENKVNFAPVATVPRVAASLSDGLIKNHAFPDGNKRIGLAAMVDFLKANGYGMTVPMAEQIVMTWRAAASEVSEEEWTAGVEVSSGPLVRPAFKV